jgi:hypothetical protein
MDVHRHIFRKEHNISVPTEQVPLLFHMRTDTDPVSETYFLEHQTMGKVQKPSNPKHNATSPEPFRIEEGCIQKYSI